MAGEWECSICGKINLDEDQFCIECYQDRADVEIKAPVDNFPYPGLKPAPKEEDEDEEDGEDENDEDY